MGRWARAGGGGGVVVVVVVVVAVGKKIEEVQNQGQPSRPKASCFILTQTLFYYFMSITGTLCLIRGLPVTT